MAERSLWRSVGALLLALLNATLILAIICLWMARGVMSTAERVSDRIGEAAVTILPLRTEIASLTEEIATTRAELTTFLSEGAGRREQAIALEAQVAGLEAQLSKLTDAVTVLGADPDALIDRAVATAVEGLGRSVSDILSSLRGMAPSPDPGL